MNVFRRWQLRAAKRRSGGRSGLVDRERATHRPAQFDDLDREEDRDQTGNDERQGSDDHVACYEAGVAGSRESREGNQAKANGFDHLACDHHAQPGTEVNIVALGLLLPRRVDREDPVGEAHQARQHAGDYARRADFNLRNADERHRRHEEGAKGHEKRLHADDAGLDSHGNLLGKGFLG